MSELLLELLKLIETKQTNSVEFNDICDNINKELGFSPISCDYCFRNPNFSWYLTKNGKEELQNYTGLYTFNNVKDLIKKLLTQEFLTQQEKELRNSHNLNFTIMPPSDVDERIKIIIYNLSTNDIINYYNLLSNDEEKFVFLQLVIDSNKYGLCINMSGDMKYPLDWLTNEYNSILSNVYNSTIEYISSYLKKNNNKKEVV